MNDVFYPRGKGLFGIRNMKIFNRWGQVVYERSGFVPNDATAAWDGNFKGKPASSDVYVYILEIVCNNSVVIPVKGNVTLLR
jgi:gliding motility-associated-like protein